MTWSLDCFWSALGTPESRSTSSAQEQYEIVETALTREYLNSMPTPMLVDALTTTDTGNNKGWDSAKTKLATRVRDSRTPLRRSRGTPTRTGSASTAESKSTWKVMTRRGQKIVRWPKPDLLLPPCTRARGTCHNEKALTKRANVGKLCTLSRRRLARRCFQACSTTKLWTIPRSSVSSLLEGHGRHSVRRADVHFWYGTMRDVCRSRSSQPLRPPCQETGCFLGHQCRECTFQSRAGVARGSETARRARAKLVPPRFSDWQRQVHQLTHLPFWSWL